MLVWLAVSGELGKLREAVSRSGVLVRLVASAFFIALNWHRRGRMSGLVDTLLLLAGIVTPVPLSGC